MTQDVATRIESMVTGLAGGEREGESGRPARTDLKTKKGREALDLQSNLMGWLMGLEPTTTGITIRDSTN